MSIRLATKRLNLSKTTLQRLKAKKLGIKEFIKQKAPKYIKDQKSRAKTGCRKIYEKAIRKILIIDDEIYVPIDPSDVNVRGFYHATTKKGAKYEDKIKPKSKFVKQFLVWQALDENGQLSDAFISEGIMNAKVYLEECLKKRLLPFLNRHHNVHQVIFWPDMATSHYSKICTEFLTANSIKFAKKRQQS
jgi:hypothetical protein